MEYLYSVTILIVMVGFMVYGYGEHKRALKRWRDKDDTKRS